MPFCSVAKVRRRHNDVHPEIPIRYERGPILYCVASREVIELARHGLNKRLAQIHSRPSPRGDVGVPRARVPHSIP